MTDSGVESDCILHWGRESFSKSEIWLKQQGQMVAAEKKKKNKHKKGLGKE